uniref:cleavage and polyadenylation specificity factor subunit 2 n=1 Tax=Myxine glutinosa TaxID=7769 RepID=UPI00358E8751
MTSIIKLTALSGVQNESALCYLLQVDEFRFLLECGWDEHFSMDVIDTLRRYIYQVDAVLVSHPDMLHLGALPYAVGKLGLNCSIYATIPVYKMGQMFMYDQFQSRHNTEDFSLFTLDDVDAAFDKIQQLKYNQIVSLKGKGHGLSLTPLPAGHMIGGTVWKIVKDGEEEIIYAVDYNHKREIHLNGCVLESVTRPSLLITDSLNALYMQARRKQRDEQLLTNILETLRNDGNVLIAVDTAGRVLELAQLLDQIWRTKDAGLAAYSLALLNNVSYNVVEFSKSLVEWMSDKLMRCFEDKRNNPFQFRHLSLCHSLADLAKVPSPKVVLCSQPDLECGFSRELFIQWAPHSRNCVIFTCRTSPGTLARKLIDNPTLRRVPLEVKKRVKLEGKELEEHLARERAKKEETRKQEQAREDDVDSSDESDMEVDGEHPSVLKTKHDLMMKNESSRKGSFFKQAKKAYPMFPFVEEKIKWDDYGEIIRPEDFFMPELMAAEEEKKLDVNQCKGEAMDRDLGDIPTKCISNLETIEMKAKMIYIDYEGRSDGESIKKLIGQMKPRQVIIVHGSADATQHLTEACRAIGGKDIKVFVPRLYETVDATSENLIYQVRLKDSLVSSLTFRRARDGELAWVDGQLDIRANTSFLDPGEAMIEGKIAADEKTTQDKEKSLSFLDDDEDDEEGEDVEDHGEKRKDIGADAEIIPTLEPLSPSKLAGHQAVFVNEPRLSDFKQVLLREGIQAEFIGGVLVCNSVLAVRRTEAGKIGLEGCVCEDYYKVRDLLYRQYAII